MRKPTNEMLSELHKAFLSCRSEQELAELLEDLCTRKEVEQMAARLAAAHLLAAGADYIQTIEESGLSSATVSRVSRCLQYGEGYKHLLEKEKASLVANDSPPQ